MKVTYIFHSCYVIEFERFSVIFDFYKDTKRSDGSRWVSDYLLNKKEDLYVFCTHSHTDHYNKEILTWKTHKENIHYIFSQEVFNKIGEHKEGIVYLDKFDTFEDGNLKGMTFGSTDLGSSFLIEVEGKKIFHAGDLNNWHWSEEVSPSEALTYENNFLCELELMSEHVQHLYLAFFPVDPRLGKEYMKGSEQFISRIQTDNFLPMHFGDKYKMANAFAQFAKSKGCNCLTLTHEGQTFNL